MEAAALERDRQALRDLGLRGVALQVAQAGLLSQRGLWSAAAEEYRTVARDRAFPEVEITLADLDLMQGLERFAEASYREVLEKQGSGLRAATLFGLGRVAVRREQFEEAEAWFRKSVEATCRKTRKSEPPR